MLENIRDWMVVLHGKAYCTGISLEKFCGTDRSTKTAKLFHLKQFRIFYNMIIIIYVYYFIYNGLVVIGTCAKLRM